MRFTQSVGSAIELKGLEFLIPLQANHIKVYHDNHLIEKYCAASNEGSFGVLHDSPDEYYHGNLAKQDAKTSGQFAGWATVETESGWALSAAVRHFWEKYPKSLELGQTGFSLGLLPTSSRTFDSFLPGNQVKHSYALRQGESRTRFMLYFHTPNPVAVNFRRNEPMPCAAGAQRLRICGKWCAGDRLSKLRATLNMSMPSN